MYKIYNIHHLDWVSLANIEYFGEILIFGFIKFDFQWKSTTYESSHWKTVFTHLHSYSTPLIDNIVLALISSNAPFKGWRSPSLHCNEPQTALLTLQKLESQILVSQ